jgi:hypothetical protein
MGMDSVEIVLCWEESLQISIPDELVANVATPRESIELLEKLVGCEQSVGPSIIQQAFYKVRNILINDFKISRNRVKARSQFSQLFPRKNRKESWDKFKKLVGVNNLSITVGWPLFSPSVTTIEDVVVELTARKAFLFKKQNEGWAKNQIREIVRCSVMYVVGVKAFPDSANYVKEIGID